MSRTFFLDTPAMKERVDIIARAIIGPTNLGSFPANRLKLEELRAIRWEQASMQEQGEALTAARSVLLEMHEQGWFS
jgi:hypothetical protein